jgi:hypothetical protein
MTITARLALGLVASGIAGVASAGSLMNETFAYPDGGLVAASAGTWTIHSGSGSDVVVSAGMAVGSMAASPDDSRPLATARAATDKTYACFQARVPTPASPLVTNHFAYLMINSTSFRSKVFITPSGATFTFGLSVAANASGTPLAVPASPLGASWPTALDYDQWHTVVISYDGVGGMSEMWIDPVDERSAKITAAEGAAANGALTAFGLRQSNAAGAAFVWNVDDLSVGPTFADACGGVTPTQKTTWGRVKTLYRN